MDKIYLIISVVLVICITVINFFLQRRSGKFLLRESTQEAVMHLLLFLVLVAYPLIVFETFTNNPKQASDSVVINIITQFLGTIISIFFTLGVIPLERLIGNTTYSITQRFLRNKVYSKALAIFCLIFFFAVLQTLFGANDYINVVFIFYLAISFITFFLLINESIRLINVMNVIKDIEEDAIALFEKYIGPIANRFTDFETQLGAMMQIKGKLVASTKMFIEPIFITTKKHIKEDQPEVVNAGINAITNITIKYFQTYQYSVMDTDELIIYITERYEDLLKTLNDTSHYAIASYFVSSLERVAVEALKVTTPLSQHNDSYFAISVPGFIKELVLSKELARNTSAAPIMGVESLERIIRIASEQGKYNIVLACLDYLVDISISCTKLNFLYANHVAKRANLAIIRLHFDILRNLNGYSYLPDSLSETIDKPLQAFIDVGQDNLRKENISPLIGSGVDLTSIGDPYQLLNQQPFSFSYLVFYLLQDESDKRVEQDLLVDYLDEIATVLNQKIMKASEKKLNNVVMDISQTTRDVSFLLLEYAWLSKLEVSSELQKLFSERFYYIFLNAIHGALQREQNHNLLEILDDCISIVGIYLLVFETWEGLPTAIISTLHENLIKLSTEAQTLYKGKYYPNYDILNKIAYIKKYFILLLLWEINILSDPNIRRKLLRIICIDIEKATWLDGRKSSLLPKSSTGFGINWTLSQPMVAYIQGPLYDFRTLLEVNSVSITNLRKVLDEARIRSNLIKVLYQIHSFKK
jgi:hypothetical protein